MNKQTQTLILGGRTYIGGFIVAGNWVTDIKGNTLAEFYSHAVAQSAATELNKLFHVVV